MPRDLTRQDNLLSLPGSVSQVALTLPSTLTENEWQEIGVKLLRAGSGVLWWIGDWWAFGEDHQYGSRKAFADELEARGGFTFQTCASAAWVSRKIETSRRLEVLPWSFHQEVVGLTPRQQDKVLAWAARLWPDKETRPTIRDVRTKVRSLKREADYGEDAVLPAGKYRVIYVDPPWDYGNERPLSAGDHNDHWPAMSIDDLCAMPIGDKALDNAVLFLWTTNAMMLDALRLIETWGFEYKTNFVWDKVLHNMGHYNSVRHEILLLAVRGSCTPDVRRLFDSVITEERTDFGVKPTIFYKIIETLYPNGKRLEVFARKRRKGWVSFGNQI